MPYVARRKFRMFGQDFAPPGNIYDFPHIVPASLVEQIPYRSLAGMLKRRMLVQVESAEIVAGDARVVTPPVATVMGLDDDPRVQNEGHGWWLVDGKRVHGRKGAEHALTELGG